MFRKHLATKVEQLKNVKLQGDNGLFEVKFNRKPISSGPEAIDEIVAQVPKVTMKDVTAEFDLYASELRKLDTAIQQANWQFDISYTQPSDIK